MTNSVENFGVSLREMPPTRKTFSRQSEHAGSILSNATHRITTVPCAERTDGRIVADTSLRVIS